MDAIAGTVLQNLSSPVLEEFGIIWNLKDDKQRIESTVSAIKNVLLDAEKKAANNQISNWLEELKDVLFDADDILDDFSTEALRRKLMIGNNLSKKVQVFFSKSNQIAYAFKMGHKMKEIRKRLDAIANNRHQLQLTDHPMETPLVYRQRQTYSYVREDEVIGREEEKNRIKSYLLDTNVADNVSLISVVGIGGLGKTTLAQLVYNDEAVQTYFELTMWVCVSDEFDIRQIAQNIIGCAQNCVIEQVQKNLRDKIRGKKYLLVLDDVWNEERELWLELKSLLMEGGKGSKIIVTTRSERVAKIMSTHQHPPLFLKGLDLERSWKLFSRVAFEKGKESHNSELVAVGKDIVKKCAGVPLAIRTVGSLLYSRNLGLSDWKYFRDVEFSKIDQREDKILSILKLSYDHLPSFLKNCFAYCSLFPKDYVFNKKTLIQLWVAEGFIQPSDDIRCVEDVGHEYFMNLLSRSFFQDVTIDDCGNISKCKIHDLMHDLAQLVAGNEYNVVSGEKEANMGKRTHHLSYHFPFTSGRKLPSSLLKGVKLRTILLSGESLLFLKNLDQSVFGSLLRLKCLRVLTLDNLNISAIPKSIKELKHLRYFYLSRVGLLQKLPSEITSLHNLQILKFFDCSVLEELPTDINKLVSLRHLELYRCYELTCMPSGLRELTRLQTLRPFVLNHTNSISSLSVLGGLNNLKELEIQWLDFLRDSAEEVGCSAMVLLEKRNLQELELRWHYHKRKESKEVASKDEMILQGLQPHYSIKRLVIDGFCGKRLPDWIENLSSLFSLEINNCQGLTSLPIGMRNLRSLHKLSICNCPLLKERCARKRGQEWHKIAHIPKVHIIDNYKPLFFV